jgi:hypothetical protein
MPMCRFFQHQIPSACLLVIRDSNAGSIVLVGIGPSDRSGQLVAVRAGPAEHPRHLAVAWEGFRGA